MVADFNNDGIPDVATPVNGGNSLGVWLGTGNGAFTLSSSSIPLHVGYYYPYGLAAGDLNGDGKVDLAYVTTDISDTHIAFGNGDGTFQSPVTIPLLGGHLGIGDVNGDGIPDLVSDYIGISLGKGGGKFGAPTYIPSHGGSPPILVSLRNNGENDIVQGNGGVLVLLNKGNGKFPGYPDTTLASSPGAIVSADFNGDGIPDVALAESAPNITLLLGAGNAKSPFTTGPVTSLTGPLLSLAVGDFNNDGIPDLVASSGSGITGSVQVYLNNGSGTFTAQSKVATSSGSYLFTGDFNHDGKLDVVSGYGIVNYGNGKGQLGTPVQLVTPYPIVQTAVGDLNNDGIPDIAVATTLAGTGYVFLSGARGFSKPTEIATEDAPMILADIDNDGNLDLIQGLFGGIDVQLGNGNGTFRPAAGVSDDSLGFAYTLVVGDFNGDGVPDLAVSDGGNLYIIVYTGNGDGSFQDAEILAPLQPFYGGLLAVDLHGQAPGQGLQDLVYTSQSALGYMINTTK